MISGLHRSNEALMRARDLVIILQFAAQQAEEDGEEATQQYASASTSLLAQIEELIRTAHSPIHEPLVDDNRRSGGTKKVPPERRTAKRSSR
jgi:hypothetical protein